MNKETLINKKDNNKGMALPELITSVILLAAFTGLYVIVVEFTNTFFMGSKTEYQEGQSFFTDQHELLMAMDEWANILSQPGIDVSEIIELSCKYPPKPPNRLWDLPGRQELPVPQGYKICLIPTSLSEAKLSDLLTSDESTKGKPGIYVLYAIPDNINHVTMPVRRIFCRPMAFC